MDLEQIKKENLNVGNIITFGKYPQETDSPVSIEWIILAKEQDKVLVVSRYGLECMEYAEEYEKLKNTDEIADISWENCSLRSWLNSEFLNSAFSSKEREQIAFTSINEDRDMGYNEVEDKLFLLSTTEAKKYIPMEEDRKCVLTPFAKEGRLFEENSIFTVSGKVSRWWWLRSSGQNPETAAVVFNDGTICYTGFSYDESGGGVRPAMWIQIE